MHAVILVKKKKKTQPYEFSKNEHLNPERISGQIRKVYQLEKKKK